MNPLATAPRPAILLGSAVPTCAGGGRAVDGADDDKGSFEVDSRRGLQLDVFRAAMTMTPLRRSRRVHVRRASLCTAFLLAVATLLPPGASAFADELLVIVNADSAVTQMSAREVRKLFLGKSRRLPDGSRAVLARFEPADTPFNERALGRSDAQVTAAWSRLRFSGRVRAPHAFDSAAELARFVAATPNAVAYLSSAELPAGVRSVFAVPD